jgi:phage shock protein A
MSLWRRFISFFGVKANAAMDRLEDPRETLEVAYRKQLAAVQDARRGVADVLTSEKRLEMEAESLRVTSERHTIAAKRALSDGDEAAARRALEREAFLTVQSERLVGEVAQIRAQRKMLESLAERMQERAEMFRTEKLALGARYTAARAATHAGENVTGLSSGMEDVAAMVERAQEKARDAQARAAALMQLSDARATTDGGVGIDEARLDARLAALRNAGASGQALTEGDL